MPVEKTGTESVVMSAVLAESDDEGGSRQGTLAQPEFEGMWDKHQTYKVEKDEDSTQSQALPQGTKMDKVSELFHRGRDDKDSAKSSLRNVTKDSLRTAEPANP